MIFQAIDNNNCVIEIIQEGQKPCTLEGAAQAWVNKFPADYSSYSYEEMYSEFIRQETEKNVSQYEVDWETAKSEAIARFDLSLIES